MVGAACSVVAGGVHAGVVDVLGGGTHVDFGSSLVVVGAGAGACQQDAQLDSSAEEITPLTSLPSLYHQVMEATPSS